jgi:hypothetical protein
MNFVRANELMQKYAYCEHCGNGYIGNGQGTLQIDDDIFRRTCKCGWSVEINDKEKPRS